MANRQLKELRELIKDKVYGIWKEESGYVIKLWNINKRSYNISIRDDKNINIIDCILKEARELNTNMLDYFNYMVFEFKISNNYNFF